MQTAPIRWPSPVRIVAALRLTATVADDLTRAPKDSLSSSETAFVNLVLKNQWGIAQVLGMAQAEMTAPAVAILETGAVG